MIARAPVEGAESEEGLGGGDGAQSLDLAQFQKMMKDLEPYIQLWNESRKKEVAAAASH